MGFIFLKVFLWSKAKSLQNKFCSLHLSAQTLVFPAVCVTTNERTNKAAIDLAVIGEGVDDDLCGRGCQWSPKLTLYIVNHELVIRETK